MRPNYAALARSLPFLAAMLFPSVASSQNDPGPVIFRIGTFDRSSREFPDGPPKTPVHFVVGQSDPSKDWYARQAATLASVADQTSPDAASAPLTISFALPNQPAPAYKIQFHLLIKDAAVPTLRVTINGKRGNFYLHPTLDSNMDDMLFDADYSSADVTFSFPGNYLHPGTNILALQAMEEADKEVPDAALTYDAIELDQDPAGFTPTASSAQITPTIFFHQRNGQLNELVDVIVRYGQRGNEAASVELNLDHHPYRQPLHFLQDFGEEKLTFSVPEFRSHTQAQVTWNIAGHSHHAAQRIDPKTKWTLFLVPHIHLDIGFSDYQAKIAAIHTRVIDEALTLTEKHPDFRFSLDGYWPLEQFLKTRTPAEQQRVIAAMLSKQIYLPAQYANLLTGFPAAETLIRSLYPSANFSREHGTPFDYPLTLYWHHEAAPDDMVDWADAATSRWFM